MGITPLAVMTMYCRSPAERQNREQALLDYLATAPSVDPAYVYPNEAVDAFLEDRPLCYQARTGARLMVFRRRVAEWACHGSFSVSSKNVSKPDDADWANAAELCRDVLAHRLCDSALLHRACSSRGWFGVRHSLGIVATPDAAKLTFLHLRGELPEARLDLAVAALDFSGSPQQHCLGDWRRLLRECRADPRFAVLLKP